MIEYLHIRDLAIIDELEVEFAPGLNVITGETGAGKSILISGLSLLRGGRATSEMVREGADSAVVEAVIHPPQTPAAAALLEDMGLDPKEELVVSRRISAKGRSRARINGELSTVTVLGRLVAALVDLTGQHDQQSLAVAANHRAILDDYGVKGELLASVGDGYRQLKEVCHELDELPVDATQRQTREEILRHQLQELEAARIQEDEEAELERERRRLASVTDLERVSHEAVEALYDGSASVTDTVSQVSRSLQQWAHVEPLLAELAHRLDEARAVAEDVSLELRSYGDGLDSDPGRLEEVEERILLLAGLKRKHGCATLEELVERVEEMQRELEALSAHDERLEELHKELSRQRAALVKASEKLSQARREGAHRLQRQVEKELVDLGMEGTRFRVRVEPREARRGDDVRLVHENVRMGPFGWDTVEMVVSANPGEPLRPVRKIASGGELSRLLLAVKTVTAAEDMVTSYVFDEVDAGIGGRVAQVVGAKLDQVSSHRQVLCVTHLPQIAAFADAHFEVEKKTVSGRTISRVGRVEGDARTDHLARMMSGSGRVTKNARRHAQEMLKRAGSL